MSDHETTLRELAGKFSESRLHAQATLAANNGLDEVTRRQWRDYADHNGALTAACLAGADALRRGTWQPIESAPKMRKIIVHYLNALGKHRTVMACYYLANALEMDDDCAEVGTYDEATGNSYAPEGWYEEHDSDNPVMRLEGEPTHWMPLPDAPTEPTR